MSKADGYLRWPRSFHDDARCAESIFPERFPSPFFSCRHVSFHHPGSRLGIPFPGILFVGWIMGEEAAESIKGYFWCAFCLLWEELPYSQ